VLLMAEKTVSKHLDHLEKHFAVTQPVLQQASKVFHQLDQLEYDLGLLDNEDSTARKSSWWPIISLIGGSSSTKEDFINHYLSSPQHPAAIQSSQHKFTVLQHTPQELGVTLPATALDADHRLPFYQIGNQIEQRFKGQGGQKINAYLELKTLNSDKLKGKLFVDTPAFGNDVHSSVQLFLSDYVLNISDLAFVFTDIFDAESVVTEKLIAKLIEQQDSNKFIYIIDHSDMSIDAAKSSSIISSWQKKLAGLGLNTGQFVILSDTDENHLNGFMAIEQRLNNVESDRSYRILQNLEQSVRDVEEVIFPEVKATIELWKERSNMTSLIVMGFLISVALFAEITMGGIIINSLFDPILGPIIVLVSLGFLIPLHLMVSRVHAKFLMRQLDERQKVLNLSENLAALFEKSLSFWRMVLPINEPVGNNKKTRLKLKQLIENTKELVQALNDGFSRDMNSSNNASTDSSRLND